ncbi:DUF3088 family protein [Litorimonas taeanensis]|uniref:DUF3088 family protein n=1 Tax=Litorimonas taeanensis TaxID=568099 RepID=A0A420WJ50_9PROT|nr:DUF3088 family protein [Litorimonas taeanensis]RKQ70945.1 DUF3088 family protein [Litorimonas taeanensis]
MHDTLFLLPPGFLDNNRREYCPECAEVWGLLSYFPAIKESLSIDYQPIEKPRADLVALLGDKNQNCPTLVLHEDSPSFDNCGIMHKSGQRFINNARDIGKYYAARFGTPYPRG